VPTWIGHWTIVPSRPMPVVAAVSMHAAHLQRRPKLAKKLIRVLKAPRSPGAAFRHCARGASLSGRLTGAAAGPTLPVRVRLRVPTWPCQCPPSRPPADSGSKLGLHVCQQVERRACFFLERTPVE
jgi:hypothetical protein